MTEYEQIPFYLDNTTQILASWLIKVLPEMSQNWWQNNVVEKLSYIQGDRVKNKGIRSLAELDLAALLRVFDQNWIELSQNHKLLYEDRTYLKEMFNIRNRWAHKPVDGYEIDDIYRDLDTIQRFLPLIKSDDNLIIQIKESKKEIFVLKENNIKAIKTNISELSSQSEKNNSFESESIINQDIPDKEKIILNKSKNLAIRIPWHDNGWTGNICKNPQRNISCLNLKNIAKEKNVDFECSISNKKISELSQDEIKKLPCLQENAAFLSNNEHQFLAVYPYRTYNGLRHIKPTQVNILPNSLLSRPFRWFRTADTPATNIITGYSKKRENEYKVKYKDSNDNPIKKTWINDPSNQKAIIEYYYSDVSEKSLLVPYLKNVPFSDDGRRIVLGVGYVKNVHDNQYYDSSDNSITEMPVIWDKVIEHDLINNGFIMPYKELYDYWVKNNHCDIDDYILFVEDEYREEFSNGSEPVSYDALLNILKKAKEIFLAIASNIPEIHCDYSSKANWIDVQIKQLIVERGIFPAIGNLLLASNNFIIPGNGEEKNIALDIIKSILFDGSYKSIEFLCNKIDNEKQLTSKQKEKAKQYISENADIIHNLSRFTLTEEQFREILKDKNNVSMNNPYLLFEDSLTKEDKLKIPLSKIDNGMFFDTETQKTIPGLVLLDTDSKERLRAFIIRELDEQSQKNGHSLLPLDYLIELINKRNLLQSLNFNKNDFSLKSYRDFIEEKIIINEIEGEIYLKLRSIEEYDKVSRSEINNRLITDKILINVSEFKATLNESLEAYRGNDTEEGINAYNEKIEALEKLAVNKISVLIGDAGTGKTTTLSAFCKHNDIKGKVKLLAPTGKARVRMWDATGKQYEAKTIAGYLIADKCYDWNTRRYKIPEKSKIELTGANVIIDESSMLTTEMFAAVLKSCSQAERIIFVGDPNQLPPIGCGKPFSDLVDHLQKEYPVNVARLSCVMRAEDLETNDFASWFKNESNSDESVFDKVEANNDPNKGIRFHKYEDNLQDVILEEIARITGMKDIDDIQGFDKSLGAKIEKQYTNFNTGGLFGIAKDQGAGSKAENWQILSPVKNSPDGTFGINDIIHEKYRPTLRNKNNKWTNNYYNFIVYGLQKIGVGDKVICTENVNSDAYPADNNNFNYVANGEIGIRVSPAKKTDFQNVEFSTQLGVSYRGKKNKNGYMEDWNYKGEDADGNLELAYAITIHKAQGSQFKNVILVLNKNSGVLSRELIYTAITRQKSSLVILYNDDFRNLIKYSDDRYSDLAKRCTDLFNPPKFIKLKEGWYEEEKIHKTKRGDMVRSKSEVIIANELENAELDWHYENDGIFVEINGKKLLPDFVINHNGKIYYWEHLGLLNKPKYQKDWAEKESYYFSQKDKILKVTKDKPNGAINSEDVIKIIEEIKRN